MFVCEFCEIFKNTFFTPKTKILYSLKKTPT